MSELSNNAKKEEESSQKDFAALLDNYQFKANELTLGQLVKGKLLKSLHPLFSLMSGQNQKGLFPLKILLIKRN